MPFKWPRRNMPVILDKWSILVIAKKLRGVTPAGFPCTTFFWESLEDSGSQLYSNRNAMLCLMSHSYFISRCYALVNLNLKLVYSNPLLYRGSPFPVLLRRVKKKNYHGFFSASQHFNTPKSYVGWIQRLITKSEHKMTKNDLIMKILV